jgi:hypothetical protein
MSPVVEMVDMTISSNMDCLKIEKGLILTITGDTAEIVSQMEIGIGTIVDLSQLLLIMLKEGITNQIKGALGPSRNQMRSISETETPTFFIKRRPQTRKSKKLVWSQILTGWWRQK